MTSSSSRLRAYACLALSMSLVGSYVALSKPLVAAFPVMLLAWLRFGIGGLAMLPWLRRPADESPITPGTRQLLFLESFLGNFLFSVCMLFGVSMTTAVSAGVIMAAIPAVVALMGWCFLGDRIGRRTWAAIACAAMGIGLMAFTNDSDQPSATGQGKAWLGNLLVLCAVLCEAAYAVIGKALTGRLGPRRITALINLWGFALMTPFGLWAARSFEFSSVGADAWALLLFYSLAASVWTVWLWMTGLRQVPSSEAGVFTVMLPVAAAAVGVVFLGERVGGLQLVALGIALLGVLLATAPGQRRPHGSG
jgi:drug/metabolite transporter (DMT)-like permease